MYLVGAPHPNKDRAVAVLTQLVRDGEQLITDVEVYQEILHRYTAIQRPDAIGAAFESLDAIADDILTFGMSEIRGCQDANRLCRRPLRSGRPACDGDAKGWDQSHPQLRRRIRHLPWNRSLGLTRYVRSSNGKLRDQILGREVFDPLGRHGRSRRNSTVSTQSRTLFAGVWRSYGASQCTRFCKSRISIEREESRSRITSYCQVWSQNLSAVRGRNPV